MQTPVPLTQKKALHREHPPTKDHKLLGDPLKPAIYATLLKLNHDRNSWNSYLLHTGHPLEPAGLQRSRQNNMPNLSATANKELKTRNEILQLKAT